MRRYIYSLLLLLFVSASCNAQMPGAGYCVGLNGSSQYATAGHPVSYNPDTSLTLEAWINPYTFSADNGIISTFGFGLFGQPLGYTFKVGTGGRLSFETPNGTLSTPTGTLYTNNWFHVAVVLSGTATSLYVNGMLITTGAHPGAVSGGTIPLHIGRSAWSGNPSYFNGEFDEMRIWDKALSIQEIRSWMCRKLNNTHTSYASLVGYWRFDDAQGSTMTDLGPLLNTATLMGQPMWGWSAAPLGDVAIYATAAPFGLSLSSPFGDTLVVDSVTGAPDLVFLYRVDETPNATANPQGYNALDTTHYFGAYMVGGVNPLFHGNYRYAGNTFYNGVSTCEIRLAVRSVGAQLYWSTGPGTPSPTLPRIDLQNYSSWQMIPGRRNNPFGISAFPGTQSCAGDSITLFGTSGSQSYFWTWNGNPIPGSSSFGMAYNVGTAGTYTLVATQNGCQYTSNAVTLSFGTPPTVTLNLPGQSCDDLPDFLLSGGSPAGGIYQGSGVNGSLFQPSIAGPGAHLVYYSLIDSNGCIGYDSSTITVHAAPTAALGAQAPVCQFAPAFALSGGTPLGGVYQGFGISNGNFDPSLTGPGLWVVEYVALGAGGCDDTAFVQLQVIAAPITPTISIGGNTLYSSSSTGNQWYDQNGLISGANAATYSPTATGTYYVIVTDQNGCQSDTSFGFPFVYVGIMGGSIAGMQVMPNPAQDHIAITWNPSGNAAYMLRILDMQGRVLIHQEGLYEGMARLDLGSLSAGAYLVELQGDGARASRLLIRE